MKLLFIINLFILSSTAFADSPVQVIGPDFIGFKRSCTPTPLPTQKKDISEFTAEMNNYNISVPLGKKVDTGNLEQFLIEFRKFPLPLRNEMKNAGARIVVWNGNSVSEDETFNATKTHDGRDWDFLPGSGGMVTKDYNVPTRFTVNYLYSKRKNKDSKPNDPDSRQGAVNLVLHEHAHTYDAIHSVGRVSSSQEFTDLLKKTPKASEFLKMLCENDYCAGSPSEAFAELFAYYYACDKSREHMENKVPAIAEFFKKLGNGNVQLTSGPQTSSQKSEDDCTNPPAVEMTAPMKPLTNVVDFMNNANQSPRAPAAQSPRSSTDVSSSSIAK